MMENNQTIVQGKVEGITGFGAFIKLADGRKGLVHISEVARGYVKEISEHLSVDDEVTVKILGTDDNGRLRLSIKQALPEEPRPAYRQQASRAGGDGGFEDTMTRFLKQSEERQLDVKRNIRKKNGGRGRH